MFHKLRKLREILQRMESVLVCYSGGVDSAFLLKVAVDELGQRAIAFTAQSPSLPERELRDARELARRLETRHVVLTTEELADPRYAQNPANRCFFCKTELMRVATRVAHDEGVTAILIGTNCDDLGGHRPGLRATNEGGARHPLVEAGLTKGEVRALSREFGLPSWDKPEMACLASRFPYGTPITADRLNQVERFEAALHDLGFPGTRVRHHDSVARIELPPEDIVRATDPTIRDQLVELGRRAGFSYVALDLAGYRRGAMNEVLAPEHRRPEADQTALASRKS